MTDARYDVVVIGGGIVGLSVAMETTRRFPDLRVLVAEKEPAVARHQSGHNSGVIHSGVYYKPGSIKARTCVEGAAAMVAFCRQHDIPHQICGKLIVATSEDELPRLDELHRRGTANGLQGLRMIGPEQMREYEPHCTGMRALVVPSTGITDYATVSGKYAEIIAAQGGTVSLNTKVTGFARRADSITVETTRGAFATRYVINCAGLHSDHISRLAGEPPKVRIIPFRGEYYDLTPQRESLVKALIYPVPDPRFPFLGVHFTRRVRGGVDAGPNAVLAFRREGYSRTSFSLGDTIETLSYSGFWKMASKYWRMSVDEFHRSFSKSAFVAALQRLVPEVRSEDLVPGGAGVRAQALNPDGTLVDDFQFVASDRMLHVYNVPSPAATASLMIGRAIVQMAQDAFQLQPTVTAQST
ncbi:MAG TPA: L-2-hydroxyglutarate oxidase [Terriglobales bacterium]|nr:L-2-hydroxyglutarate oxidase [Terriglobales bacterium]